MRAEVVEFIELNPLSIINRLEILNQEKAIENSGVLIQVLEVLNENFPDIEYLNNKGLITPISIYCSALYLQLARLEASFNMSKAKTKAGGISGISKRGFTKKDFMDRYTTGPKRQFGVTLLSKKKR